MTAIQVDASAFSGPSLAPGWDPADIQGGDVAPIEAVMVDAGRIQPLTPESVRSVTPALDAGQALALALGVDPKAVTLPSVPHPRRPADRVRAIGSADRSVDRDDEPL